MADARIHESAFVDEGAIIGSRTLVWHHAHIRSGARIGEDSVIGKGVYVGAGVQVGSRCKIQNYALIFEGARIGNGVFIGPAAIIANDRYPRAVTPDGALKTAEDWHLGSVAIEQGAAIGAGAILVPDCTVGRWALVAAGATVSGGVRDHALMAGSPAKQIGWACMCGRRLTPAGNEWVCPACGRTYDL